MKKRSLNISRIAALVAVVVAITSCAGVANRRQAALLVADCEQQIDTLMPLMSAEDIESRYEHQIALQDLCSRAARPNAEGERRAMSLALINTLEDDMPDTVRNWLVLQLERIGVGEAIPALTALLESDDANLRDYARRALEQNPDKRATKALADALDRATDTTWKIGLLNSLGLRGDSKASAAIDNALHDIDRSVVSAAVTALANLGGEDNARTLLLVIERAKGDLRSKAAQGVVQIAKSLADNGDTAAAAGVYGMLYDGLNAVDRDNADTKLDGVRSAALIGLAICDSARSAELIMDAIANENASIRADAVQAARQIPSGVPALALIGLLSELPEETQVQVLTLAAERGAETSVAHIEKLLVAEDEADLPSEGVRLAAVKALAGIGGADAVRALTIQACCDNDTIAKSAQKELAVIDDPDADTIIAGKAASGETDVRVAAITLMGQRRSPGAREKLIAFAADKNAAVSDAAFKAFAEVAKADDIPALIKMIAGAKNDKQRKSAEATLKSVASKADDKEAAAKMIVAAMRKADADAKPSLVRALGPVGGKTALDAVVKAAKSKDETLRDAGIRALCVWPDCSASKDLIAIAANKKTTLIHHVLGIAGAAKAIKADTSAPLDTRVDLCLAALDAARRDAEKTQVIAALGTLPSKKASEALLALTDNEELRVAAGLATVGVANSLRAKDRKASRALAEKVKAMNISKAVNQAADKVIKGKK